MNELAFDFSRPAFVAGSGTSREAADSIKRDGARLRTAVLVEIASRGVTGATCDQVEAALDMRHQTASARMRELYLRGFIRDSGFRRRTRSGRSAVVYVAVKP